MPAAITMSALLERDASRSLNQQTLAVWTVNNLCKLPTAMRRCFRIYARYAATSAAERELQISTADSAQGEGGVYLVRAPDEDATKSHRCDVIEDLHESRPISMFGKCASISPRQHRIASLLYEMTDPRSPLTEAH
eukprot:4780662-Pleurochrysis_carterae.AAC.3